MTTAITSTVAPHPARAFSARHPLPANCGERVEIEFAARADSISHERARGRCVRCFTLRPADAFYRGDVTERSVMAVGRSPTAPPLLGVSSLDLAPLALASGAFFIASGLRSRAADVAKKTRRPKPARPGKWWSAPQSRRLGASGTFFQWVRLSAMILVDCNAAWLKVAYSTISRCTRAASLCSV